MDSAVIKLIVKGDTLVPYMEKDVSLLKQYSRQIGEGAVVIGFLDRASSEKMLGHLAKVHKNIRTLSSHLGYTVDEMKKLVKYQAGLYVNVNDEIEYKSFADCTKDELGLALQSCVDIGITTDCWIT